MHSKHLWENMFINQWFQRKSYMQNTNISTVQICSYRVQIESQWTQETDCYLNSEVWLFVYNSKQKWCYYLSTWWDIIRKHVLTPQEARDWTQPIEYISLRHQLYFRWRKRNNEGSDWRPMVKSLLLACTLQELPQDLSLKAPSAPLPLFYVPITA